MKKLIEIIIIMILLFIIITTLLDCNKKDIYILPSNKDTTTIIAKDSTKDTIIIKPPKDTIIIPPSNIQGMVIFYWDNVETYPDNMSWGSDDNGNFSYDCPTIPNTEGTPSISSIIPGCTNWNVATGYNNNDNSVNTTIERYPGHPSLHLQVYPFSPAIPIGYDSGIDGQGTANCRSEIYLSSNNFGHTLAYSSELWMSWSYYFPNLDYAFDPYFDPVNKDNSAEGAIHQIYVGAPGVSPPVEIWQHAAWGNKLIISINGKAHATTYPLVAGHWLDFVEHVIWSTGSDGLYELWIKDVTTGVDTKLLTVNGANTPIESGGTPKLGFYHYYWHSTSKTPAQSSINAGCDHLELYLGPVKIMYNLSGNYNSDGKAAVQP